MQRHSPILLMLCLSLTLTACGSGQPMRKKSQWDQMDYVRISRENRPVDNDAFYTPPVNYGCLDDAPTNDDKSCQ